MTAAQLRLQLIQIIVKGAARGTGNGTITAADASIILDALTASDEAPEWNACRQPGRDVLRKVIRDYYRPALAA